MWFNFESLFPIAGCHLICWIDQEVTNEVKLGIQLWNLASIMSTCKKKYARTGNIRFYNSSILHYKLSVFHISNLLRTKKKGDTEKALGKSSHVYQRVWRKKIWQRRKEMNPETQEIFCSKWNGISEKTRECHKMYCPFKMFIKFIVVITQISRKTSWYSIVSTNFYVDQCSRA